VVTLSGFSTGRVHLDSEIPARLFGHFPDDREVALYTLSNPSGMTLTVTDYGGIITSLRVPDRRGEFQDVVLGYDRLEDYLEETPYFGAIIGRYANRISEGRFALDGKRYELAVNNGKNHLHGGVKGYDKVLWQAKPFVDGDDHGIVFTYLSTDGEEGYPGNLNVQVTYRLTPDNTLVFSYRATTDRATPINLTQHSYFNLAGPSSNSILDHVLVLRANAFTPIDEGLIPTGEIRLVEGTPFDFRTPRAIGTFIDSGGEQLEYGRGYDHNFVLSDTTSVLHQAARVVEPGSGRIMDVYTTEPGIQFYSGNFLDGSLIGKSGRPYEYRSGFCLETQHFPDSPNQPAFPSTILRPGETFSSQTVYSFTMD